MELYLHIAIRFQCVVFIHKDYFVFVIIFDDTKLIDKSYKQAK
jgi:hypothetical protein